MFPQQQGPPSSSLYLLSLTASLSYGSDASGFVDLSRYIVQIYISQSLGGQ